MKKNFLVLLIPLLIIFACSPFSRNALKQVDVTAPFQEVQKDPQKYMKSNVLWGGVIIDTDVKTSGTVFKVMDKNLDFQKRPEEGDISGGRFIVRYPGFLDPAVYKPGREVTVIGALSGVEVAPVGELQYSYPVIDSKQIHLWGARAKYRRPAYWDSPMIPFAYDSYPYLYNRPPYWP
jgi:outer membrane lipoprotein